MYVARDRRSSPQFSRVILAKRFEELSPNLLTPCFPRMPDTFHPTSESTDHLQTVYQHPAFPFHISRCANSPIPSVSSRPSSRSQTQRLSLTSPLGPYTGRPTSLVLPTSRIKASHSSLAHTFHCCGAISGRRVSTTFHLRERGGCSSSKPDDPQASSFAYQR